jgi:Protein of unknown function (DUF2510)
VPIVLMVAGSAGAWAYSSEVSITIYGLDRDGKLTLGLAIGAAILLIAHRQVSGLSIGPLIGMILVGVVCVLILVADINDIHSKSLALRWGIVVDLVGAALLIGVPVVLIVQAPKRRTPTPLAPGLGTPAAGQSPGQSPQATAQQAAAAPANWYTDPHGQARLRYWDGTRWTEHTAP